MTVQVVETIQKANERIQEVKDTARILGERFQYDIAPIEINAIITGTVDLLKRMGVPMTYIEKVDWNI